jgi:hypothetical protein
MRSLKFKMYTSLIFGKLGIVFGLYLFISNSDKTAGRFCILMGLSSIIIGMYIFCMTKKREPKEHI